MNKVFFIGEDLIKVLLSHLVNVQPANILPICDALRMLKEHVAATEEGTPAVVKAPRDAVKK